MRSGHISMLDDLLRSSLHTFNAGPAAAKGPSAALSPRTSLRRRGTTPPLSLAGSALHLGPYRRPARDCDALISRSMAPAFALRALSFVRRVVHTFSAGPAADKAPSAALSPRRSLRRSGTTPPLTLAGSALHLGPSRRSARDTDALVARVTATKLALRLPSSARLRFDYVW